MTIAINHHSQTSPNASPRSFNDSTHTGGASSGALQEHTAKALFAQMVTGMQHCHNLGVGHRDMSLENIMYSKPKADAPMHPEGTIKIIDFGMCLRVPQDEATGARLKVPPQGTCGKKNYIAPEVMDNTNAFNPLLTDVYVQE